MRLFILKLLPPTICYYNWLLTQVLDVVPIPVNVNWYLGKDTKNRSASTKLRRSRKLSDEDKENSICNHPMQGTGADGFKTALIDLDRQLVGQDAQVVHILHDEIIVEARKDIAGEIAVTMKNSMERAFTEIFPDILFVVTPEIRDFPRRFESFLCLIKAIRISP